MLRRRREQSTIPTRADCAFTDFHEWALSLPWVVERPYSPGTPGVRSFGVECELLGRRQLWLVTGLHRELDANGIGLAVILPTDAADEVEAAGWGRGISPMPSRHVLVTLFDHSFNGRQELEALVLTAYGYAMS